MWNGITHTHTMTLQYLVLEDPGILFGYLRIGQDAKTRVDPITNVGCLSHKEMFIADLSAVQ